MTLTDTIALPELLWTAWCIPGLIFLLRLLLKAFQDWRWVVNHQLNSVREYAAITNVIVFTTMSLTQLVFVIVGVVAMMIPPAVPNTVASLTYVLTGLFMFASITKSIFAGIIMVRYNTLVERIENRGEKRYADITSH